MGYNTYLSIVNRLGHPLPNRQNYVLSYEQVNDQSVTTVTDLKAFLEKYQNSENDLFVIGGKSVYEQCLPIADYLYITFIHQTFDGDTYFENLDLSLFEKISENNQDELSFTIYKRR